jgi:regulator of sigma E protease
MIPVWIPQLLLSLMILVTLHELGHFGFAKWFKTRVERFIIFFDPYFTPIEKKIGETTYGFGWLPLGGYVKISGMIDESMDTSHIGTEAQPWEFRSKTAVQRFFIMSGGILVNILLSFVIYAGILMYYGRTHVKNEGLKYGLHFNEKMRNIGFQEGDVVTKIGTETVQYVDPKQFVTAVIIKDVKEVTVMRDGAPVQINISTDFVRSLTSGGAKAKKEGLYEPRIRFEIDSVIKGTPAQAAGVLKGDKPLTVNDQSAMYFHEFTHLANELKDKDATIAVLRGSDTLRLPIKFSPAGTIGVARSTEGQFETLKERFSFTEAIPAGIGESMAFLETQIASFGKMFKGEIKAKDNLGSVISIGKMFGNTWDWERFWMLTASLSMLLAFMNLLPIPGLDGGYIFFLIWEMITGKRVSDQFMIKAVNIGFFLLMGLMIYAMGNDIYRHYIQ